MLYPKENKLQKKLMFVCRRCNYEQEAESPIVFRHEIVKGAANQLASIPDDIITDPSLQREKSILCPKCNQNGALIIQPKATPTDNRMKLIFVCLNEQCIHKWQA
jgi:DNA-directed RNA polymerase II subunit RPB9